MPNLSLICAAYFSFSMFSSFYVIDILLSFHFQWGQPSFSSVENLTLSCSQLRKQQAKHMTSQMLELLKRDQRRQQPSSCLVFLHTSTGLIFSGAFLGDFTSTIGGRYSISLDTGAANFVYSLTSGLCVKDRKSCFVSKTVHHPPKRGLMPSSTMQSFPYL